MSHYQGDYYQGDYYQGDLLRRLRRWTRKRGAPALRRLAPVAAALVPGVGLVGAAAIKAATRIGSAAPTRTLGADELVNLLTRGSAGSPARKGERLPSDPTTTKPIKRPRAKGAAKRRPAAAAPRRRVMSPYQRNRQRRLLAQARARR